MTITTITQLKQSSYPLKDGEFINHPFDGRERFFRNRNATLSYNWNGSTLIFYDETQNTFVVPIPNDMLEIVERILLQNNYTRNKELFVPLSNGMSKPQEAERWDNIRNKIKLIA